MMLLLGLSGCGRFGFDATGGAQPDADPAAPDADPTAPDADPTAPDANPNPANRIFVTVGSYDGSLGGLAGADDICADEAATAGYLGEFRALLSIDGTAPILRGTGSRGWIRADGQPVYDNPIPNDRMLFPFDQRPDGSHLADLVWSVNADSADPCDGYTSAAVASSGNVSPSASAHWFATGGTTTSCDQTYPLACIETGANVAVSITPSVGRRVFVSEATFVPTAGLAQADLLCASEALTAGLMGTYRAALATSTASAAARFDLGGPPWVWPNGAPLLPPGTTLDTATALAVALDQAADGSRNIAFEPIAIGAPSFGALATANCADWSNPSSVFVRYTWQYTGGGTQACTTTKRLLCLKA